MKPLELKISRRSCVHRIFLFLLNLFIFFSFTGFFSSCESFLEVELPDNQLAGETVYKEYSTAEASLTNIYSEIRDNSLLTGGGFGVGNLIGLYADELELYSSSISVQENFYNNSLLPTGSSVSSIWDSSYNLIYAANAVIEGTENSIELTPEEKEQLIGEASFIRALLHFYLVNLYGDTPYITTTNYVENAVVSRIPREEIYGRIIADLIVAKELLPIDYLSPLRVRPNKWAASALLSRVYLYAEDWKKAADEAGSVIYETELYSLPDELNQVFLKESSGTIWQLMPAVPGANTLEAQNFIVLSAPPPNIALTAELVAAFSTGDKRLEQWIGSVAGDENSFFFPNKYKERTNTGASKELSILLRLAEQYLIYAEAQAKLGNLQEAVESLNVIRTRAGLEELMVIDQKELLNAILEERRREFFTEFGHRWFDLKRTSRANEVLSQLKPGWDQKDILLPIPESEILVNPNLLPQNPGY